MSIITITTDFGLRDGYVGVMKGVIWGICPDAKIVDITHLIPPQDVHQGGIALQRIVPYFPENTLHVAVVDPGVGTNRKPIAVKIGARIFVGPDNGLFSRVIQSGITAGEDVISIELDQPKYWLSEISHVFHGRDIFAPVAAHLATGIAFDEIGTPFSNPIILELPEPNLLENRIDGEVISIDNFGNLATNIMDTHLEKY
ncbi:MAG TPA: SAM-dependent chlorinase/fluorinase, partial [Anaerolineaceae bacterium]|nr:SAM-dependent chlorinase/fluorinase [Anaerolineaceae bacterium]